MPRTQVDIIFQTVLAAEFCSQYKRIIMLQIPSKNIKMSRCLKSVPILHLWNKNWDMNLKNNFFFLFILAKKPRSYENTTCLFAVLDGK